MQTQDIELEPTTVGERGQRFRVHYAGGVLIESTPDPERDACRALIALGITGTLRTRWRGAKHWSMQLNIERDAQFSVSETDQRGLQLVRWRPFMAGDASKASRTAESSPRTAENGPAATMGLGGHDRPPSASLSSRCNSTW
jgi:hypothetical protein